MKNLGQVLKTTTHSGMVVTYVGVNCNAINTAITMCKLFHFNTYKPQKRQIKKYQLQTSTKSPNFTPNLRCNYGRHTYVGRSSEQFS